MSTTTDSPAATAGSNAGSNAGALPVRGRVVWRDPAGGLHDFSPEQLSERVRQIATGLHAAGVRPGDRVAGLMGRRPAAMATAMATMRLGAIWVPLLGNWSADVLGARGAAARVSYVVVDQAHRDLADALAQVEVLVVSGNGRDGDRVIDVVRRDREVPEVVPVSPEDTAALVFAFDARAPHVAGRVRHCFPDTLLPYVDHALAPEPGDLVLSTAHPGGTYGLFTTGIAPLVHGVSRAMLHAEFTVAAWTDGLATTRASHLLAAADGLERVAAADPRLPATLRVVVSAGRPLDTDTVRWWRANGVEVREVWDQEGTGPVLLDGRPLPGFEVRVEAPDGVPGTLAVRDDGRLLVSGPAVDGWRTCDQTAVRDEAGLVRLLPGTGGHR